MQKTFIIQIAVLLFVALTSSSAPAAAERCADLDCLRVEIERLANEFPGRVGVYARALGTGETVEVNADEAFPMASVVKIPILVQFYREVDAGRLNPTERIELTKADRVAGTGLLRHTTPGLRPSLEDLALLMIAISDNEAADALLARLGPEAVTQTMGEMGLGAIRVDRSIRRLIQDYLIQGGERFTVDPRDHATPRAIGELLAAIENNDAASAVSCRRMLDILHLQIYRDRIPRYLAGVRIAHKTGSIGPVVNDSGIIDVGDQAVVLSVFIIRGDPTVPEHVAAECIGNIAREVYDFFDAPRGIEVGQGLAQ